MKSDITENRKVEVMDRMRKTEDNTGGKSPMSRIRFLLVLVTLLGLFLSADWYLPHTVSADTLLHNSTNTGSGKWPSDGGWGVPGGKYGEFVCETCHVRLAPNIKSIRSSITTPDNTKGALPGDGQPILFDRTSGTVGDPGTMGDDSNTPRTSSNKICEICHTYSTGTDGVNVHAYNSQGANLGNHMEANATDCTVCHKHKDGFKAIACDMCHGNPPTVDTAGVAGGLADYQTKTTGSTSAGKHATHTGAPLSFTCDACHKNYVMPMESATANPGFWDISIGFSNFGSTAGSYSGQLGLSYNQAAGTGGMTCSTVYCHSGTGSGLAGNNMTPTWTGAVVCGDCHKATGANPPTLGSHARHAGSNTVGGQLNLACSDCHGTNGVGAKGHADGKIQWSMNTSLQRIGSGAQYNGATSGTIDNLAPSSSYQTCSSIYCHSNVQGLNGSGTPTSYKTPTWGGGALGCGGCHALNSGPAGTGSHIKHANVYGFACSVCHNNAGDETADHANYVIDMNFSGQASGTGYSQNPNVPGDGYGFCSTSYCHSNVQAPGGNAPATIYGNPTWGDTVSISCSGCHTDMSTTTDLTLGTHQRHTNAKDAFNNDIAKFSCSMCHGSGYSSSTVNTATHANGSIDTNFTGKAAGTIYDQAGINTPGVGGYGTCQNSACHGRATKNWGDSSSLTLCEKCHGSAASIAVDNGFRDTAGSVGSAYAGTHKSHLTSIHNYSDQIHCENCHVEPTEFGNSVTGEGHTGSIFVAPYIADITWSDLAKGKIYDPLNPGVPPTSGTHSPAYDPQTRTCSNTYCHTQSGYDINANPPQWGSLSYLNGTGCDKCHGAPPAYPHPNSAVDGCKGCHYNVQSSGTAFEASYKLIEGICSKRTYDSQATCESAGGTWTPADTIVPGKTLHVDGRKQATNDACLDCHSTSGQFALIGQHYLHTDNDYFLSRLNETATGSGITTSGSTTTVVDTAQSWTPTDMVAVPPVYGLKDKYVRITSGPNKNKQIRITSNTSNTITLASSFASAVTAGVSYEVRDPKLLSNDDYNDPGWIYTIEYIDGFPRYACGFCHPDNSSNHRNGTVNLDMDPTHSLPGTVKTKNDTNGPWFNQTISGSNVTCVAVYCHSNGYVDPNTNSYQYKETPNWYAATPWAAIDRCAQCHGNSPNTGGSIGTPAHSKHAVGIHYKDTFSGTSGKMATAHGDGNSTTINCNICHNDTVKVSVNDNNATCAACHSGATAKGVMTVDLNNTTHVNGNPDVVFSTPLNLKTKAQLRDKITDVASLNSSWTRNNGYKKVTPSVSHDQTKTTPTYGAGTCSDTACHNATPMQWGQAGPLQCMVCHLGLPK